MVLNEDMQVTKTCYNNHFEVDMQVNGESSIIFKWWLAVFKWISSDITLVVEFIPFNCE